MFSFKLRLRVHQNVVSWRLGAAPCTQLGELTMLPMPSSRLWMGTPLSIPSPVSTFSFLSIHCPRPIPLLIVKSQHICIIEQPFLGTIGEEVWHCCCSPVSIHLTSEENVVSCVVCEAVRLCCRSTLWERSLDRAERMSNDFRRWPAVALPCWVAVQWRTKIRWLLSNTRTAKYIEIGAITFLPMMKDWHCCIVMLFW